MPPEYAAQGEDQHQDDHHNQDILGQPGDESVQQGYRLDGGDRGFQLQRVSIALADVEPDHAAAVGGEQIGAGVVVDIDLLRDEADVLEGERYGLGGGRDNERRCDETDGAEKDWFGDGCSHAMYSPRW